MRDHLSQMRNLWMVLLGNPLHNHQIILIIIYATTSMYANIKIRYEMKNKLFKLLKPIPINLYKYLLGCCREWRTPRMTSRSPLPRMPPLKMTFSIASWSSFSLISLVASKAMTTMLFFFSIYPDQVLQIYPLRWRCDQVISKLISLDSCVCSWMHGCLASW